ncbi:MAG: photosynthetic complex assembly protein PuhC [Rhodobacter sp.]|nr:photosynthetic complex assembly protein PuhC [Rhodobacter sp.]
MSDQTFTPRAPALRNTDREMIPKVLVRAMFALAMASLAIVSFAVLTDRPHVGVPPAAKALQSRGLILEGSGAKAVRVLARDGTVLADLAHGGFITVIQNAMAHERGKNGIAGNPPVDLVAYANGRLAIHDPATGWSAELGNFGKDNKAAFERLLTN